MKSSSTSLTVDAVAAESVSGFSVWMELFKARLSLMVVMTTMAGFFIGYQGTIDYGLMLHAILGTTLLAAGAAALNQLLEREHDALMPRTENRPLPARRLSPAMVLWVGMAVSVVGFLELWFCVTA